MKQKLPENITSWEEEDCYSTDSHMQCQIKLELQRLDGALSLF